MNKLVFILSFTLFAASSTRAARVSRTLLDQPNVPGTNVQKTSEYTRFGRDEVLQTDAQSQARSGDANSITQTVADSFKADQIDSDSRATLQGISAQGLISNEASGTGTGNAAKEVYGMSRVTSYGSGMKLDASTRIDLASTDSQRDIQRLLDNPRAATRSAAQSAYAASFSKSNEWTD